MKKAENYSDLEKENNIRYMIKGMDLSSNQGKVDFSRIKESEISFVMIRCGYGKNVESQDDFYFERNVSECEKYQIPWGSYFYSYAVNMAEAEDELRHILRLLNGKRPLYPVFINMAEFPESGVMVTSLTSFPSLSTGYGVLSSFGVTVKV